MAGQGRKRKPVAVKLAEGNRSKVARDKLDNALEATGAPRIPLHLSADERLLWASTVQSMPPGLFKRADEAILECFAVALVQFREVTKMIARTGYLVQSPNGPARNPLLVIQNHANRAIHRGASELGLSPAARARLTNVEADDSDPFELLLGMSDQPDAPWSSARRN